MNGISIDDLLSSNYYSSEALTQDNINFKNMIDENVESMNNIKMVVKRTGEAVKEIEDAVMEIESKRNNDRTESSEEEDVVHLKEVVPSIQVVSPDDTV